jgi:hypothetical protein
MKSFKEYLTESKKSYSFRVKVAGELPQNFEKKLKECLGATNPTVVEKSKTPIQAKPLDFPELENMEVYTFEVTCEYPITTPELAVHVGYLVPESNFRVRNGNDPAEAEHATFDLEPSGEALLDEVEYKDTKIKHKDYFGNDFNKGFLKDLEKTAKARKKEDGQGEYKLPKGKQDKAGAKSALGS